MKEELSKTHEIAFHLGELAIICRNQHWPPKMKKGQPGLDVINILKRDIEIFEELKIEHLSKGYNEWVEYFEKNYTIGQQFTPEDLLRFSEDVNGWIGTIKSELKNIKLEKTERTVEGKLKKLIKEVKTLENKIDKLQEELSSWKADISE